MQFPWNSPSAVLVWGKGRCAHLEIWVCFKALNSIQTHDYQHFCFFVFGFMEWELSFDPKPVWVDQSHKSGWRTLEKCSDKSTIRQFIILEYFVCTLIYRLIKFTGKHLKASYFFIFLSLKKAIYVIFEEFVKIRYFKILLTFNMVIGHGDISSGKLEGSHSWRNAIFGSPWQSLM